MTQKSPPNGKRLQFTCQQLHTAGAIGASYGRCGVEHPPKNGFYELLEKAALWCYTSTKALSSTNSTPMETPTLRNRSTPAPAHDCVPLRVNFFEAPNIFDKSVE